MNTFKQYLTENTQIPLKTLKGSTIKRYQNNVGKDMFKTGVGIVVYLHKNYALELVPKEIYVKATRQLPKGFIFNTIVWSPTPQAIRFDKASNFNTEREPWPEIGYWVGVNGSIKQQVAGMNQIWHHKWLWVKDDYTGFNVQKSYDWSKEWLQYISSPSGYMQKWQEQLKQHGLE